MFRAQTLFTFVLCQLFPGLPVLHILGVFLAAISQSACGLLEQDSRVYSGST